MHDKCIHCGVAEDWHVTLNAESECHNCIEQQRNDFRDKFKEALKILYLIDDGSECYFDHHGNCQNHCSDAPCAIAMAREFMNKNVKLLEQVEEELRN